ncbi:MAG TPA: DUF2807 domain-containing protein [Ferruginibacter sp.]|nr:DUF2807 domain-containing protein [Ferruginibacter sp.]
MKKKIIIYTALLFTITVTAFAQKEPGQVINNDPLTYNKPFEKIVVEDDIELVLIESNEKQIKFEGSAVDLEKVNWSIKRGSIYLGSKLGSLKDKVKVILYVKDLKAIEINGNSVIKTSGHLSSKNLDIMMNGQAWVDILNAGKINVQRGEDIELNVRKKTKAVSINR